MRDKEIRDKETGERRYGIVCISFPLSLIPING